MKKSDFKTKIKKTGELSRSEVLSMYEIYNPHHNVDFNSFKKRITENFTEFGLYFVKKTKELIGFSGARINQFKIGKKKINTVYFGSMFILNKYRGFGLAPAHTLRVCLRKRFKHIFGKLILWGDCISYKSFISIQNNCKEVYPSYDRKIPSFMSELRDKIGFEYYPEEYCMGKGIVMKKQNRLKDHITEINPKDLENKHIRYYAEINPDYKDGYGVIVIIPINFTNLNSTFIHTTEKIFKKRKPKTIVEKPKVLELEQDCGPIESVQL